MRPMKRELVEIIACVALGMAIAALIGAAVAFAMNAPQSP